MGEIASNTSQGKSLLDTYLSYHDFELRPMKGQKVANRDGMAFMPLFLLDAMNILYTEYIAPLPLKHKEKQLRTRMHDAYLHFVKQEFMAFDDDQKCEICDLIDEFEEHIHNEVEVFRVATMGKFLKYDTEVRLTLSAILACNVLAQSASILYKAQRLKENPYIVSVETWSYKLLNEYADKKIDRSSTQTDLNKFQDIDTSYKGICNAVIDFATKCKF